MENLSGDGSHHLTDLRSKLRTNPGNDIVVERTIYQHQTARTSQDVNERSLVNWKADIYTEELKAKKNV